MTRVAAAPRIPGGPRPRGTITGPLSAAGTRAIVRWDDGLVSSMPTHSLVELPAPQATVWFDEGRIMQRNFAPCTAPPPWVVDCERDGEFQGSMTFATEAEARAWAERWN